jgi:hypothetical protein
MTGDSEAILALRKHVALHASMQGQMKGAQTEVAARSAVPHQVLAPSTSRSTSATRLSKRWAGTKRTSSSRRSSRRSATRQVQRRHPRGAMARTRTRSLRGVGQRPAVQSPATHATNAIGNALVAIGSVVERLRTRGIGTARGLVFRDPAGSHQRRRGEGVPLRHDGGPEGRRCISPPKVSAPCAMRSARGVQGDVKALDA